MFQGNSHKSTVDSASSTHSACIKLITFYLRVGAVTADFKSSTSAPGEGLPLAISPSSNVNPIAVAHGANRSPVKADNIVVYAKHLGQIRGFKETYKNLFLTDNQRLHEVSLALMPAACTSLLFVQCAKQHHQVKFVKLCTCSRRYVYTHYTAGVQCSRLYNVCVSDL